mgnify:CR=1 FL=1
MNKNKLSKKIFSGKIHQARHDHFLQVEDLAGFSGLTEIQIRSLEEGVNKENCFVDDAHAIDCAKRVANSLGFTQTYFLSQEINLHESKNNTNENQVNLDNVSDIHMGSYKSNPILNLNVLSDIDFPFYVQNTKNIKTKQFKLFYGVFSNSPSLMAPILITAIAVFYMVIHYI